jgi:hypothetical protein
MQMTAEEEVGNPLGKWKNNIGPIKESMWLDLKYLENDL